MSQFMESEEWKSLNKIWKNLSLDCRKECYLDFQIVYERLKKFWEIDNMSYETEQNNEFQYVNVLSDEAKNLFFYALKFKKINLYHSAMAVISGHGLKGSTEAVEFYFKKYAKKRPYIMENPSAMQEIVTLCYSRLEERSKSNE